jgi:predicted phage terminase large subunit-like protein
VRFWDLSAGKGDYSVGVLIGMLGKDVYVLDVQRYRLPPGEQERRIRVTAELDNATYGSVPIRLEQEGASGGPFTVQHFSEVLAGYDFVGVPIVGSKQQRAGPLSAACEHHHVYVVRAAWTRAFVDELAAFPRAGVPDDQVDAATGAYNALHSGRLAQSAGFTPVYARRRAASTFTSGRS